MKNLIKIENLSKTYPGGVQALHNVDLNVEPGEFLILLGLSGSGKSTLLRSINRLTEPSSGKIQFDNQDVTAANHHELRKIRQHIGMIFQQFNLIKNISVIKNVLSGKLGYKSGIASLFWSHQEIEEAEHNLRRVGLWEYRNQAVKNLSGGQQQRVAIARALMQKPRLILADEPVASLDPATADSIMRYLGELNQKDGLAVICSLHFLSLARKYGTRVVALKQGRLVWQGKPDEIDESRFKEIYGEDAEEVEIR